MHECTDAANVRQDGALLERLVIAIEAIAAHYRPPAEQARMDLETMALAMLMDAGLKPKVTAIAEALNAQGYEVSKKTLYRMPRFKAALMRVRGSVVMTPAAGPRRGHRTADRSIEAYAEDEGD